MKKKLLSFVLALSMAVSTFAGNTVMAAEAAEVSVDVDSEQESGEDAVEELTEAQEQDSEVIVIEDTAEADLSAVEETAEDVMDPEEAEALENEDAGYFKYMNQQNQEPGEGLQDVEADESYLDANDVETVSTEWNGTTYYHDVEKVNGRDIHVGIDVSYHNGTIDWKRVKAAGVEFVFLRIGYRGYGSSGNLLPDRKFEEYLAGAKSVGLKVGVYIYSQAITIEEGQQEAEYVLSLLYDEENDTYTELDLPVVIDYEYYISKGSYGRLDRSLDAATKTAICNKFCAVIERTDYQACIYANKSMLTSDMNYQSISSEYEIWLAHYTKGPSNYAGAYTYWQCSDTAKVDGIEGNVDLDFGYYPEAEHTLKKADDGKWYAYVGDRIDKTFTGFLANNKGTWYVKKGMVDFDYTSVAKGSDGWYYVKGGKINYSANTVVKRVETDTWWYVKNGKVSFETTDIVRRVETDTWWYVKNGRVRFDITSVEKRQSDSTWWYVKNGRVRTDVDSVVKRVESDTWWVVRGGQVRFGYNGMAQNSKGWWRIRKGQVDFTFTGYMTVASGTYYVVKGKVRR